MNRSMDWMIRWSRLVGLLLLMPSPGAAEEEPIFIEVPAALKDYDASVEVHVRTPAEAEAVRLKVIQYIWGKNTLPTDKQPTATTVHEGKAPLAADLAETLATKEQVDWAKSPTEPLDHTLVSRIEKLHVDVACEYYATLYLVHPARNAGSVRLLVVHQGHQGGLIDGIGNLANRGLADGFTVLLSQMPMTGWNDCREVRYPNATESNDWRNVDAHNHLLYAEARNLDHALNATRYGFSGLRFFLEPVVVGINYFLAQHPRHGGIAMAGLSGGGWTTDLVAAIDPRVTVSIPVAGSYPLYLRPHYPNAGGDAEQWMPALYEKRASYLDLYILGAWGPGRKRIQVLNQFERLFGGVGSRTYKDVVSRTVQALGQGESVVVLDSSHRGHQISNWAIDTVIMPQLRSMAAPNR